MVHYIERVGILLCTFLIFSHNAISQDPPNLQNRRLLADQGDAGAQLNLGTSYERGLGVIEDPIAAYMWYSLPAARGDDEAILRQKTLAAQPSSEQIAETEKMVRNWKAGQLKSSVAEPKPTPVSVESVLSGVRTPSVPPATLASFQTIVTSSQSPGEVRVNPQDGQKYAWIPPGTFLMGCSPEDEQCKPEERPPHQVTISKGFWIGQTKVTVAAYRLFVHAIDYEMPRDPLGPDGKKTFDAKSNERWPIVNVAPIEAQAFCKWAGGRLATEAEWEYAARGMDKNARYGDLDDIGYSNNQNGQQLHEVALKRPNRFGLYDMLGVTHEWVSDWYSAAYYQRSPSTDPKGPAESEADKLSEPGLSGPDAEMVTLRGGVRASSRSGGPHGFTLSDASFRCVREVLVP
jgi:formylglycine-generating enzyme required for sulfatase activity